MPGGGLPGGFGGTRTIVRLVVALVGWTGSVTLSQYIALQGVAYRVALFVHVMAMVLGFGAVLSVMLCGLRVISGRMSFSTASKVAVVVDPGIWIGYATLIASGAFLRPDLSSTWMRAKLVLALAVCVNGILALPSMQVLLDLPADGGLEVVPLGLRIQLLAQTTISQLTWWSTILISYFALTP